MRKQGQQRRRRAKAANASDHRKPSNQKINGETLRLAVTWVVNEKSFQNLKFAVRALVDLRHGR